MDILYLFGFFFTLCVDMHPGPEPEFLQRTGKAQKTMKSICNTGSWKRLIALKAHNTQDRIGQTEEQELVDMLPYEAPRRTPGQTPRQTSGQAQRQAPRRTP